ncbi:MAG: alpha-glucosidase/alpha-galactosidase [Lentisphaeria bacterium]|nr:alpha-glucosidase/alpha-galactosidase [Lentisphaerota bacterium]MBR7145033.1 alpha-glucosidase/alpha-galactosidase [Lentisphaeria bacterium]
MTKITFMGAGSSVFVRNIIGDCMCRDALKDATIALYDIDAERLKESLTLLTALNDSINQGRMKFECYCGTENRKKALAGTDFVVNAIQVGGYKPSTVIDFEIPEKYGLRQTIADTLGIGGIFRALRTIPVMLDFARDMEDVCPDAWFLNYTNPMAALTGAMLRGSSIKTVGLCHSVQVCAAALLASLGHGKHSELEKMPYKFKTAGINHQGWLLELYDENGVDIYPALREEAKIKVPQMRQAKENKHYDIIRLEIMNKFGYYVTESSEHSAEYMPYWIKRNYPDLIEEYNIPLNEYPRRCVNHIRKWREQYEAIVRDPVQTHTLSREYGSGIIEGMVLDKPYHFGGNVLNDNFITNLPCEAVVEVPCIADASGIRGEFVGRLPTQCAALNMTNINPTLLTVDAAFDRKRETVYQAAMLDPHTAAELSIDDIISMCDELFEAHGNMLPEYK